MIFYSRKANISIYLFFLYYFFVKLFRIRADISVSFHIFATQNIKKHIHYKPNNFEV